MYYVADVYDVQCVMLHCAVLILLFIDSGNDLVLQLLFIDIGNDLVLQDDWYQ